MNASLGSAIISFISICLYSFMIVQADPVLAGLPRSFDLDISRMFQTLVFF